MMLRPLAVLLLVAAAPPQTPPQTAAQAPSRSFTAGITAIQVDVIVRDRHGRPVPGLGKADFRLLEDGVPQDVVTVTASGAAAATTAPAAGTSAVAAMPMPAPAPAVAKTASDAPAPSFLALVFDRLSPEARASAYKGALSYLETNRDREYAGVYVIDLSLVEVQAYTNDREKLAVAIRKAATRATSPFDTDAIRDTLHGVAASFGDSAADVPVVASPESPGRPAIASDGASSVDPYLQAARGVSTNSWERLARDQQGYATTNALMALATGLGTLPGRKAIVFFAEALAIPDAVLPQLQSVIATANRGNVSIYTIDAAGLRVHSGDAQTAREIRAMGNAGLAVNDDGSSQSSLGMLERMADVLRKDPRTSLTLLSGPTGGFLAENTNDLAGAFARIDADRRSYYVLSYVPKDPEFNGEWRDLQVTVPGRGVTVRSRSGYLAARAPLDAPLLSWEAPALAALDRRPSPSEIPLRTAAFVFPEDDGTATVPVLVATDARALAIDSGSDDTRMDFTILTRLTNAGGRALRTDSQPYRLTGTREAMASARAGQVLYFRKATLPAGRYTLESVVHDALGRRAGVARVQFEVPAAPPDLPAVSDLVVINRTEPGRAGQADAHNPLFVDGVLVYPNLGEPFQKSQAASLGFLLRIAGARSPSARLQVLRGQAVLADLPATLPPADPTGRIAWLARLPLAALPPATYVLRATVTQGGRTQTRDAVLTVVE